MLNYINKTFHSVKYLFKSLAPVFTRENLPPITFSSVITAVSIGLNFLTPYVFSKAVIAFNDGEPQDLVGIELSGMSLAGIYGALWTTSNILNNVRSLSLVPLAPNTSKKMAMQFMDHVMDQQSLSYHNTTPQGNQIALLIKCYMSGQNLSSGFVGTIIPATAEMGLALGILTKIYGQEIALCMLGMIVVYSIYSTLTKNQVTRLREIMASKGQAAYEQFTKTISQYEIIKQFNSWSYTRNILNTKVEESAQADIDGMAIIYKTGIGQSLITGLGLTGIGLLVGAGINKGRYTVSDYITIMSYLAQFSASLYIFGQTLNQFFASVTEMQMVLKELEKKSDVLDLYPDVDLLVERSNAKIEFKNVSFSYGKDQAGNELKVLDNVSFVIYPGQKVGIVATSGTGKTTIGNLIFRFYEVGSGQILINDTDIKTVSLRSLRAAIGVVPQNPTLFNDTVYKNIEFGGLGSSPAPSKEMIEETIRTVCLEEVVAKLKNGVHTEIGEKGAKLSGGQQQRIAIARCLMKKPKIYIFDEATSALDAKVENEIQKNIDKISEGVTSINFTHKLSSLTNAHNIIVLDNGKIAEQGAHHTLLSNEGLYAELWNKQHSSVQHEEEQIHEADKTVSHVNYFVERSFSSGLRHHSIFAQTENLAECSECVVDIRPISKR